MKVSTLILILTASIILIAVTALTLYMVWKNNLPYVALPQLMII